MSRSLPRSASEFHPNGFSGELPLLDVGAVAGAEAFLTLEIANVRGEFPSEEQEGEASQLKA